MAGRQINLITQKQALTPQEAQLRQAIRKWMPIILILYVAILFVIFLVSYFFRMQSDKLDVSIEQEKQAIKTRSQDEGLYLLIKQKMNSLSKIVTNRFDYSKVSDFFLNLQTDTIRFNQITIKATGETVLTITTADAYALDEFIRQLIDDTSDQFGTVELVSLEQNQDFQYQLVLNVQYKNIILN